MDMAFDSIKGNLIIPICHLLCERIYNQDIKLASFPDTRPCGAIGACVDMHTALLSRQHYALRS